MHSWKNLRKLNFPFVRYFSNGKRNYYDVLGISKTATSKEVKDAFYSLSKKYHPDVIGSDSKRFLEVKEAYDTLKDDDKRRAYDSGYTSDFDPFSHQRPQSDFSRGAYRNVRRDYEFRQNHHYSQEEIDRIWRQFQEQIKKRVNADYDEKMKQQARERHYNDFIRNRTNRWQQYSEEHQKKSPFENPHYRQGWNIFNKILLTYFVIFFVVTLIRIGFGPINQVEEKVVVTQNRNGNKVYSYEESKERLRRMMETPPTNSQEMPPVDPTYPYGFPKFDRKE